jgi:hypothetical protein
MMVARMTAFNKAMAMPIMHAEPGTFCKRTRNGPGDEFGIERYLNKLDLMYSAIHNSTREFSNYVAPFRANGEAFQVSLERAYLFA